MLQALKLKNFQKHTSRTIDLDGVTVLVGPSDAGKSAIVRALYWLFLHKPTGDAFITEGETSAKVSLKTSAGVISKSRNGTATILKFKGESFKATAGKVPDEILKELPISELNFQLQHDPAFWLQMSPGQVSSELNRIANLQLIDQSLAFIKSARTKSKTKSELAEERRVLKRRELAELHFVPDMRAQLESVLELEIEYTNAAAQEEQIGKSVKEASESLAEWRSAQSALDAFEPIHTTYSDWRARCGVVELLKSLVSEIERTEAGCAFVDSDFSLVAKLEQKYASLEQKSERLSDLIESIEVSRKQVEDYNKSATDLHEQLHNEFETCPLCQSRLK